MTRIKGFPKVKELARDLAAIMAEMQPGSVLEVRLQVVDGRWHVFHGPSIFDRTTYRGWWAYGSIDRHTDARVLARRLIAEAREDHSLYPDAQLPCSLLPEPRVDSLHHDGF
jgi:hypothetical protein